MRHRAAVLLVAIGVACAGVVPAGAQSGGGEIVLAQAQQQQRDSLSIFRFLRREPKGVVVMEPPRGTSTRPRSERSRKAAPRKQNSKARAASRQQQERKRRSRPAATAKKAAPPPPVVVEKAAEAERVLVVGDFMAGAMAKGLTEAYADNGNVVVADANSGSSGLVRADHYDWPTEIKALVDKEQPSAIVVLIGSNDRQTIGSDTGSHVMGTPGWEKAYAARISAFAEALRATGKPILWGSLVPVRSTAMSRDYSAMNSTFRNALDGSGITFVDLWNGFADQEGQFIGSGPDVAGQNAQLRASDGINFTRAGQRKLAFFAQQHLDDILKTGVAPQVASAGAQDVYGPPMPAGEAAPRIGPMIPIEALLSAPAGLSSSPAATSDRGAAGTIVVERLDGAAGKTPKLRADNYLGAPSY